MTFLLRFTSPYNAHQHFYFCNLGDVWPGRPERRLIARTSEDRKDAKAFDSEEDARTTLVTAGDPKGWTIVPA